MKKWKQKLCIVSAALPTVAAAQAVAADASATSTPPPEKVPESARRDDPSVLPTVVVTAQRFKQFLQEVPLSVSVLSADELKSRSVTTLDALQYSVPGLSMYEYGIGQQFVQLRGVSNTLGSSTVGMYLDETPLALDHQGNGVSVRLLDMERVEVLRGPQATLYGEGSMGGTIRYIPAAPRLENFSGSVEARYSSVKSGGTGYEATAILNAPLVTDTLGLRLVASRERVGGFIDSAVIPDQDVNLATIDTVRGTLLAQVNDRLSLSLLGLYQNSDQRYQDFGIDGRTTAALPTYTKDRYSLVQAKIDYDLEVAMLTGSISTINRNNQVQSDLTWYFGQYLPALGVPAGSITQIAYPTHSDYDITNAELRLSSQGQQALGWTAGVTYRALKLDTLSEMHAAPGALPLTLLGSELHLKTRTFAAFGEVNYALTGRLKGTLGLRAYTQRLDQDSLTTQLGQTSPELHQGKFNTLNPRVNLSYQFSRDAMAYVNVAKGFRGGGFNFTSSASGGTVPSTFAPDKIWTYEIGTKQQLFNNRVFIDASVYHSEWSDVQSYLFTQGNPVLIITNSGHVRGSGVDLSVFAKPVKGLTLSFTYGWNNLAFDRATGDKVPGDPVDGAVRQSYSASLDYRLPLGEGLTGFFRADYQHADSAQMTLRNFNQVISKPARNLTSFRLGTSVGKADYTLFVDNAFDTRTPNIIGPFGVFNENLEQRPRTMGISVRYGF